jgi:hypothetical protein
MGVCGSGPKTDPCRKVLLHVKFFLDDDILLCCLYRKLIHVLKSLLVQVSCMKGCLGDRVTTLVAVLLRQVHTN